MKIKTILLISSLLFSLYSCSEKVETDSIKGLLYLDGNPVSIEITDGKIANIKHLPSGTKVPEFFVAPGLIDIQIMAIWALILQIKN